MSKAGDLLDDFNPWKEDGRGRNIYGESKLSKSFVIFLKRTRKCKRAFIGGRYVSSLESGVVGERESRSRKNRKNV